MKQDREKNRRNLSSHKRPQTFWVAIHGKIAQLSKQAESLNCCNTLKIFENDALPYSSTK